MYRKSDVSSPVRAAGGDVGGGSENLVAGFYADDAARCVTAGYSTRYDWETENFVATNSAMGFDWYASQSQSMPVGENIPPPLKTTMQPAVMVETYPLDLRNSGRDPEKMDAVNRQGLGVGSSEDPAHTLTKEFVHGVAHGIQGNMIGRQPSAGPVGSGVSEDVSFTLTKADVHALPHARTIVFDTTQITSAANFSVPKEGDPCHPPAAGAHPPAVAFDLRGKDGGAQIERTNDAANARATSGGSSRSAAPDQWMVRRLTPKECERLMGFPDDFTNIPYRGKNDSPDTVRYRALGNSMAVNVMSWIGRRIDLMESLIRDGKV